MTRTLFLISLFFAVSAGSQTDTIFKKDDQVIVCRITVINNHIIYYMDKDEVGKFIELNRVRAYTRNGVRKNPSRRIEPGLSNKLVDTVNVSDELFYMRSCLSKFHTQYTTGMSITLIGGALTATSFFLESDQGIQKAFGIGGAVIMLVGIATSMDAHKWINRAGWGVGGKGNMVEVRYRFK